MPATWRLTCAYPARRCTLMIRFWVGRPRWAENASLARGSRAHNGYMGRIIGTILSAILAIWLVVTVAGGILATLKTFLIVALIAMVVFIVVWLVARGSRRS